HVRNGLTWPLYCRPHLLPIVVLSLPGASPWTNQSSMASRGGSPPPGRGAAWAASSAVWSSAARAGRDRAATAATQHQHHKRHKPRCPASGACGTTCCAPGQLCQNGACVACQGQAATCQGKQCGQATNTCGQTFACGTCASGEICQNGICA